MEAEIVRLPLEVVAVDQVLDAVRALGNGMTGPCSLLERELNTAADVDPGFCGVVLEAPAGEVLPDFRAVFDREGVPYLLRPGELALWRYRVVRRGFVMKQGYLGPAGPGHPGGEVFDFARQLLG